MQKVKQEIVVSTALRFANRKIFEQCIVQYSSLDCTQYCSILSMFFFYFRDLWVSQGRQEGEVMMVER